MPKAREHLKVGVLSCNTVSMFLLVLYWLLKQVLLLFLLLDIQCYYALFDKHAVASHDASRFAY